MHVVKLNQVIFLSFPWQKEFCRKNAVLIVQRLLTNLNLHLLKSCLEKNMLKYID